MKSGEIQDAQKICLNTLKVFIEICEKYQLQYYVGGGTMLGAVRHRGFIPWDDDVDVDMPRKDYQKFLEISDEALKDNPFYEVVNFYKGNTYNVDSTRFVDKRKKIVFTNRVIPVETCVGIDITPVDGLPDQLVLRKIYMTKLNLIRGIYKLSILKLGGVVTNAAKKQKREWYKKLLVYLGTVLPLNKFFHYDTWARRYDRALRQYSDRDCKLIGALQSYHGNKSIFPVEWYGKGSKYQFEDIEVVGVDNYDKYLTQLYGDYMKPPDNIEKYAHDIVIVTNQ